MDETNVTSILPCHFTYAEYSHLPGPVCSSLARTFYSHCAFTVYFLLVSYNSRSVITIYVYVCNEAALYLQQSRMCQLQVEMDQLRTESEARVTREIGPIQEQLQLHVQTVGILVGEKTELQAALMKSQNLAKQKASM